MARTRTMQRAVSDEEKGRRRADILRAAKRVFARKGFYATTIADIAKAAKLSYGSVYWYFDSKENLFHAVMDHEEQALRDYVWPRAGAGAGVGVGENPREIMRRAVQATFEYFEADRAAAKVLFRDSYALGSQFEKHLFGIYERFVDDIEAMIEEAQRRKVIIAAPPRIIAFSIAALIGQLALRRLTTTDDLDAGVLADFVVSLTLDGLLPR
jgi:AcrR family transcriptional regulator